MSCIKVLFRPVGELILRVSIIDRMDDSIDVAVTNVSSARMTFVTLFKPGGSVRRLWIERDVKPTIRGLTASLTRLSGSAMLARPALERSYVNRAAALFRYLTGIERQQVAG